MKIMFASDIHGSEYYCRKMIEAYYAERASRLVLLGDLLYHGPRNDLPKDYAPKEVIKLLNDMKEELLCVCGNCDAFVDQMVLDFPIMAEYMTMFMDGYTFYVTHGHKYNPDNLPPLKDNDILITGHTHVPAIKINPNYLYLNPGSVAIPKNGNKHSYMIYENKVFTIKDFEDNTKLSYKLK